MYKKKLIGLDWSIVYVVLLIISVIFLPSQLKLYIHIKSVHAFVAGSFSGPTCGEPPDHFLPLPLRVC